MKKYSLILAVSVLAISFPISATIAVAQEEQDAKLPSLVISATGYETPQSQVSSDITVITKEEISHLPVHDVGEALNWGDFNKGWWAWHATISFDPGFRLYPCEDTD